MGLLWVVRAAKPTSPGVSLVLCRFARQPCSLPFCPGPFLLPSQLCPASLAPSASLLHLPSHLLLPPHPQGPLLPRLLFEAGSCASGYSRQDSLLERCPHPGPEPL